MSALRFFELFLQKRNDSPKIFVTLHPQNIKRKIYWRDHNPPHIHFTYGEYECTISVLDRVVSGKAPSKVIAKVNEWMDLHEAEILTLLEKAQKGEKLGRIEPLK